MASQKKTKSTQAIINLTKQLVILNKAMVRGARASVRANNPNNPNHPHFRKVSPVASRIAGASPEWTTALLLRSVTQSVTDWQRTAAGMGVNINEAYEKNAEVMKDLPGGLQTSMETLVDGMKSGLRTNTKGIFSLAAQTSLTGQSLEDMMDLMAKLESVGRISIKGMDSLGTDLIDLAGTYQIQTGELIKTLEGISDSSTDLMLVGGNVEALNKGVALLESALGKQLGPAIVGLTKGLMSTDENAFITAGMIGSSNDRLALQNAKSGEEVANILLTAATKSERALKPFVGINGDKLFGMGRGFEVFGEAFIRDGAIISKRAKDLGSSLFKTLETNDKYTKSIENLRKLAIDPLVRVITKGLIPIVEKITNIPGGTQTLQFGVSTLGPLLLSRFFLTFLENTLGSFRVDKKTSGAGLLFTIGRFLPFILAAVGAVVAAKHIFGSKEAEEISDSTRGLLEESRKKNRVDLETSEFNMRSNEKIKDIIEDTNSVMRFNLQETEKKTIQRLDELIQEVRRLRPELSIPNRGGK